MLTFNTLRLKLSRSLEIDRAVLLAILGKMWALPAGMVTALLVVACFSPELQGFYYAFNALLAFQIFAELGLGTVLIHYASHEWAMLAIDRDGRVTGDPDALSRLASLARFALKWYVIAGALVGMVLAIGGLSFFASAGEQTFSWKGPWILLCVATGLTLCVTPLWALLEGCNQVANVYTYRFVQTVVSTMATWAAICLGANLWVAFITSLAGLSITIVLIGRRYGRFIGTILLTRPQGPCLVWRTDVLPMQWRIALSWISGYLAFSLFTPVLFHYQGPVVAGRMGMTWTFVSALTALAASWVAPKAPTFGILIAQRRYAELDRLFWRITAIVVGVTVAGAVGIWGLVFVLNALDHPFATRLLSPTSTGYLLAATIITCASLPMATYLRAHKKEPLLGISLVHGLLTAVAVVVYAKYDSVAGVAVAYLAVTLVVTPFVALIWYKRRAGWHGHATG